MAVKVCGLAQKGNFVQKPSSRQRQHASVRIAESLARFLHCSAQPIFTLKMRWTRTQATIPCDVLLGGVPFGTLLFPSFWQCQHTSVCIDKSLARFLHCSAQPVAQTALRWWQQTRLLSKTAFVLATTNRAIARMLSNQARERVIVAIPHDRLLGEACCARKTDDISVAISLAWWRAVRHVALQ